MKRLKPGQLCTIEKHVYRCKKAHSALFACVNCQKANDALCILGKNGCHKSCVKTFGMTNYPVLIK